MPASTTKPRRVSKHAKPEKLTLEEWQIALRRQDGPERRLQMENTGEHSVYSDFIVTDPASGERCKVAIRSRETGLNYCSCRDFRTNTLGTCEHIEFVWNKLKHTRGLGRAISSEYVAPYSSMSGHWRRDATSLLKGMHFQRLRTYRSLQLEIRQERLSGTRKSGPESQMAIS